MYIVSVLLKRSKKDCTAWLALHLCSYSKGLKIFFSLIWQQKSEGHSSSYSPSKTSRKVCLFLEVLSYFCVSGNSFLLWVCSCRPASIHKTYKPSERQPQQRAAPLLLGVNVNVWGFLFVFGYVVLMA